MRPDLEADICHSDTVSAFFIAAAYAENEDEFIILTGLRDPHEDGSWWVQKAFRDRYEAIKHKVTLDEYRDVFLKIYRNKGSTCAETLRRCVTPEFLEAIKTKKCTLKMTGHWVD